MSGTISSIVVSSALSKRSSAALASSAEPSFLGRGILDNSDLRHLLNSSQLTALKFRRSRGVNIATLRSSTVLIGKWSVLTGRCSRWTVQVVTCWASSREMKTLSGRVRVLLRNVSSVGVPAANVISIP